MKVHHVVFLLALLCATGWAVVGDDFPQAPPAVPIAKLSAEELEQRADALRSQKDYASALEMYRKASAKAPKNAVLWNKAGMVELQLGHFDASRTAFQKAIKLNKQYADALNNLGVTYYRQADFKRAVQYYQRALKIRDSASFHSNLGSAYFEQKKFQWAIDEYRKALELDPEVFERSSAFGISLRVSRPEDRAKFAFMLARLYAKAGDVDHALNQLRRAIENGYKDLDPVMKEEDFAQLRQDPRFAEVMNLKVPGIPE